MKEIGKQLRLQFEIMSREVIRAAYKAYNYSLITGKFCSIALVAGVAAVVLLSLLCVGCGGRGEDRESFTTAGMTTSSLLLLLRD